jgi:hypothetical protein
MPNLQDRPLLYNIPRRRASPHPVARHPLSLYLADRQERVGNLARGSVAYDVLRPVDGTPGFRNTAAGLRTAAHHDAEQPQWAVPAPLFEGGLRQYKDAGPLVLNRGHCVGGWLGLSREPLQRGLWEAVCRCW